MSSWPTIPTIPPRPTPFGSGITTRGYSSVNYRYSFNGKEKDNEVFEGCLAFEARIFDSRLGKFLSLDPRMAEYAWQTPYAYFKNSPVSVLDIAGMGGPYQEDGGNTTQGCGTSEDPNTCASGAQGAVSSSASAPDPEPVCGPAPPPQFVADDAATSCAAMKTVEAANTLTNFVISINVGETDWLMTERDCWWNNGWPKSQEVLDHAPSSQSDCYDYSSYKSPVGFVQFDISVAENNGVFNVQTGGSPSRVTQNQGNHKSELGGSAYLQPIPNTVDEYYFIGVVQVATSEEGISLGVGKGPISLSVDVGNVPSGTLYSQFSCKVKISKVDNKMVMSLSDVKVNITPNGIKMDDDTSRAFSGDVKDSEWQIHLQNAGTR